MFFPSFFQSGESLQTVKGHDNKINDIQKSLDEMMFITASKDNLSKLYDLECMQVLKTYKTDRPVNSAAISPIRDQVSILYDPIKGVFVSLLVCVRPVSVKSALICLDHNYAKRIHKKD